LKQWVLDNLPADSADIDLLVTGHSLGAAVATIASNDLAKTFPGRNVYLINFGSPRVGNTDFAKQVVETVRLVERNVNRNGQLPDLVTILPPVAFGFTHVGKENSVMGKEPKGWFGNAIKWIVNGVTTIAGAVVSIVGDVMSLVKATVKVVINGVTETLVVAAGTIALTRCLAGNILSTGVAPNIITVVSAVTSEVTDIGAAVDLHDMTIYLDRLACPAI